MTNDWAVPEETFEDVALDTLRDYVGVTLVGEDGSPFVMTEVKRTGPYEVQYMLAGMPIPWLSNVHELVSYIGNSYARAQSRGYNRKEAE